MVRLLASALLGLLFAPLPASGQEARSLTVASTTSTEQSGLFGHLLPIFQAETGIEVRVVAVGTGQALAIGAKGDADAVLVHDRPGEERFVADGHGIDRREVMANDFVLVGPKTDPAGIRGQRSATEALKRIAASKVPFASRGDDSGTHRMELRLWKAAAVEPKILGADYREMGQGMGPTLNAAAAMDAYTLTDRATWAAFRNRQNLDVLSEGDPALLNPYASILVNPAKGPHIKAADAKIWHEWLTSDPGRAAIASYRIDGEQVFFPTGTKPGR